MKRIKTIFFILTAACMMTGCSSSKKIELTKEQNDMVAEYIAGALLRYDMRYEEELIYTSEGLEEETEPVLSPQPEMTQTPETEKVPEQPAGKDAEQVTYSSLDDIFSQEGITISYKESNFYDSYPKESTGYFVIEPKASHKLLVIELKMKNGSSKEKKIDLSAAGITYDLTLGEKSYKPLLTALPNDLRYLDASIEAGKAKNAVIVFEVEKEAKLEKGKLLITRDSKTAQIDPL